MPATKNRTQKNLFMAEQEKLRFNDENQGLIERHFPYDGRFPELGSSFYLSLIKEYISQPEELQVSLVYLRLSKTTWSYETVEYEKTINVILLPAPPGERSEVKIKVNLETEQGILYKIRYRSQGPAAKSILSSLLFNNAKT